MRIRNLCPICGYDNSMRNKIDGLIEETILILRGIQVGDKDPL